MDIALGVDASGNKDEGVGDQGMMFGYACCEMDVLMPVLIFYVHSILRIFVYAWYFGSVLGFGSDVKSQVTLRYVGDRLVEVVSVVVSI